MTAIVVPTISGVPKLLDLPVPAAGEEVGGSVACGEEEEEEEEVEIREEVGETGGVVMDGGVEREDEVVGVEVEDVLVIVDVEEGCDVVVVETESSFVVDVCGVPGRDRWINDGSRRWRSGAVG